MLGNVGRSTAPWDAAPVDPLAAVPVAPPDPGGTGTGGVVAVVVVGAAFPKRGLVPPLQPAAMATNSNAAPIGTRLAARTRLARFDLMSSSPIAM
jgi:hypothetical protein